MKYILRNENVRALCIIISCLYYVHSTEMIDFVWVRCSSIIFMNTSYYIHKPYVICEVGIVTRCREKSRSSFWLYIIVYTAVNQNTSTIYLPTIHWSTFKVKGWGVGQSFGWGTILKGTGESIHEKYIWKLLTKIKIPSELCSKLNPRQI